MLNVKIEADGSFVITGKIDPTAAKPSSSNKNTLHFFQQWGPAITPSGDNALIDGKPASVTLTLATKKS